MEHGIVDAAVVTFKDVFDGGEGIKGLKVARSTAATTTGLVASRTSSRVGGRFAEAGNVPNAYRLVHGRGDDEIVLEVKLGRHDIV